MTLNLSAKSRIMTQFYLSKFSHAFCFFHDHRDLISSLHKSLFLRPLCFSSKVERARISISIYPYIPSESYSYRINSEKHLSSMALCFVSFVVGSRSEIDIRARTDVTWYRRCSDRGLLTAVWLVYKCVWEEYISHYWAIVVLSLWRHGNHSHSLHLSHLIRGIIFCFTSLST